MSAARRSVALVTLGCARNDVDSEEMAGRLGDDGWVLTDDASRADVVVVNTCGFVEAAKKDSVDALLAAADVAAGDVAAGGARAGSGRRPRVVAVGCLAERYGADLAAALPEADAVLSFDDYPEISARLAGVLAGVPHPAHTPRDRRRLLPVAPAARAPAPAAGAAPAPAGSPAAGFLPAGIGPASGPPTPRRRLDGGPVAPLKLASGCDRRCAFCAIPSFRGAFVSRHPAEVLAEARWLAAQGAREIVLVSENTTSYGKDLGDLRLLESLLPELAAVDGVVRVRASYLQPAEMRAGLLDALAGTPGVAPYFDLSFQHAAAGVLRRMRRFGDTERFLDLLGEVRRRCPEAGVRSNVIVGFPGESAADVEELTGFLTAARLDAVGVFGYSDEDGTEAATYPGKLPADEIAARVDHVGRLAEELTAQRAEDRLGSVVEVLVEEVGAAAAEGRSAHQAPEVDGLTTLRAVQVAGRRLRPGDLVRARVVATAGVDLDAEPVEVLT